MRQTFVFKKTGNYNNVLPIPKQSNHSNGDVENPIVLDTFNVDLNEVVIDKVKQTKYKPAKQNGRPVKVRFKLPIVFK